MSYSEIQPSLGEKQRAGQFPIAKHAIYLRAPDVASPACASSLAPKLHGWRLSKSGRAFVIDATSMQGA